MSTNNLTLIGVVTTTVGATKCFTVSACAKARAKAMAVVCKRQIVVHYHHQMKTIHNKSVASAQPKFYIFQTPLFS